MKGTLSDRRNHKLLRRLKKFSSGVTTASSLEINMVSKTILGIKLVHAQWGGQWRNECAWRTVNGSAPVVMQAESIIGGVADCEHPTSPTKHIYAINFLL